MLKVGIFAPYTRSETTLAAVQLADWLLRCGIEVSFIAEDRAKQGIHPVWDKKVMSAKNRNIYKWATNTTHLCWFSPHSYALHLVGLVTRSNAKQRTRHMFFPTWGSWSKDHEFFTLTADRTICLSQSMALWLDKRYKREQTNRTWANLVSPATIVVPKQGWTNSKQRRLMVVLTRAVNLDISPDFIDEFAVLLSISDLVHITFLLDKSVPKTYRRRLKGLMSSFPGRVQVIRDVPYYDYVRLARQHDWVYVSSTRYTYGSLLSLLATSSVPLICNDVAPVSAYVNNGTTGRLLPSQTYGKSSPVAEVNGEVVMAELNSILHLAEVTLKTFQHNVQSYLHHKQAAFQKFLTKEFMQ